MKEVIDQPVKPPKESRTFEETPLGKALAVLGMVWFLMMLFGCAEKDPLPTIEEQLHGAWVRTGGFIENKYRFADGALDVYSVFSNQIVYQNNYVYTTDGQTLRLLDLVEGTRHEFRVEFPTDSTATLSPPFGLNIHLKRASP